MQGLGKILRLLPVAMLLAAFVPAPVYSQDEPAAEETLDSGDVASDTEGETAAEDSENASDVLETDDESYRDIDDQDFTPSEEIPADQSITFPTDI